jgi:hypothetical protein
MQMNKLIWISVGLGLRGRRHPIYRAQRRFIGPLRMFHDPDEKVISIIEGRAKRGMIGSM